MESKGLLVIVGIGFMLEFKKFVKVLKLLDKQLIYYQKEGDKAMPKKFDLQKVQFTVGLNLQEGI